MIQDLDAKYGQTQITCSDLSTRAEALHRTRVFFLISFDGPCLSSFRTQQSTPNMSQDAAEQNIQMWKVKKLIKSLDSARGYFSCGNLTNDLHADRSW